MGPRKSRVSTSALFLAPERLIRCECRDWGARTGKWIVCRTSATSDPQQCSAESVESAWDPRRGSRYNFQSFMRALAKSCGDVLC